MKTIFFNFFLLLTLGFTASLDAQTSVLETPVPTQSVVLYDGPCQVPVQICVSNVYVAPRGPNLASAGRSVLYAVRTTTCGVRRTAANFAGCMRSRARVAANRLRISCR